MSERESIAARIRALRAKTVENGCTEAEALAAAELLAKLLAKHNMTLDEAELRASPFQHHRERHDDLVGERLWRVADGIAFLTGARYWVSRPGVSPVEISFFGYDHEVEVARYLLEICARAMRGEHQRLEQFWGLLVPAARRRKVVPVLDGMADRLRERLRQMKPPPPTGKGLVVLHGHLIDLEMRDRRLSTETKPAGAGRTHEPGYADGRRAADRVALNPGVTAGGRAQGRLR